MSILIILSGLFILTPLSADKPSKLERLIMQGNLDKAENYCAKRSGKKREACYGTLGDAHWELNNFEKAIACYEKGNNKQGFDKAGDYFMTAKNPRKALDYYLKGTSEPGRAMAYGKLADMDRDNNNLTAAKEKYTAAIEQYEELIKRFGYILKWKYQNDWKRCISERDKLPETDGEKEIQTKLKTILHNTGQYCERMEKASIYFFCSEFIDEYVDFSRKKFENRMATHSEKRVIPMGIHRVGVTISKIKRKYLYQYQLIKEKPEDQAAESRILLDDNGKETRVENAELKTVYYKHKKILFGPIGIMGPRWQRHYYYKFIKEDTLDNKQMYVLEAFPLGHRQENTLFGTVWVDAEDYSVAKIVWNPKSVQNSRQIMAIAGAFSETPHVVFISEYLKERNSIRFPSRFYAEESYVKPKGKTFVRVRIEVLYKDYKYFNVNIGEIKYEDPLKESK